MPSIIVKGPVCEGISPTTCFPARRKRGASGQFHILMGGVPKRGGACESLRLSPCVLVQPDGWARGEREGYGGPCDVTSLSLNKNPWRKKSLLRPSKRCPSKRGWAKSRAKGEKKTRMRLPFRRGRLLAQSSQYLSRTGAI